MSQREKLSLQVQTTKVFLAFNKTDDGSYSTNPLRFSRTAGIPNEPQQLIGRADELPKWTHCAPNLVFAQQPHRRREIGCIRRTAQLGED